VTEANATETNPLPPTLVSTNVPTNAPTPPRQRQFPCNNCGAMLTFAPGTQALRCNHCGTENQITPDASALIEELDYLKQLQTAHTEHSGAEAIVFHCDGCGAESTLPDETTAGNCPFCGRAVVATGAAKRVIKPRSLLPFAIPKTDAKAKFETWIGSLWFAPRKLSKQVKSDGISGVYVPAWTYDCVAATTYTGQRGTHYMVSESYTSIENGRSVRRTRSVQRTRWNSAAGNVTDSFDDVLVLADRALPDDLRNKLSGWDLANLTAYEDAYLSGFVAEAYQVDLPEGFTLAQQAMQPQIQTSVRTDIGGDEQRIDDMQSQYDRITFKHILLPLWISAYRYNDKTFHFVINGRTGTVFGQRPYSAIKIAATVLVVLLIVGILVLLFTNK